MNILKKIGGVINKAQKKIIKKTQQGVEHAVSEAAGEVVNIAEDKKRDIAAWTFDRLVNFFDSKGAILKCVAAIMKAYKEEFLREL